LKEINMFFNIKATSMPGIEYELSEAIFKADKRYFGCTPKQYLTTTLGLGIKDFHDPKRAGRDMVRKMITIGRLKEKQKRTGGLRPVERGSAFLHHTTWEKYKKCADGRLLDLNSKSIETISKTMSQLTFGVAQQFWTRAILEDMVALPYGVEMMFFTMTKQVAEDSPFGNNTIEPVCIVDAEKLLQPLLRVLSSSKHTDGRNMRYTRRVGKSRRLVNMNYWANASAAPTLKGAVSAMKNTLSANYAEAGVEIEFSPPAPLDVGWNKKIDYRYHRLWATELKADRKAELHLPTMEQVNVDIDPAPDKEEADPAKEGAAALQEDEIVIPVEGDGRIKAILKTKEEQKAWDMMIREGEEEAGVITR
jgi:hypothetical protein